MKKDLLLFVLFTMLLMPFCTTSKQGMSDKSGKPKMPAYSYTADIAPVMKQHCTPCHFPDGGRLKFLDTHAAVSNNIDEILYRVQLPQDSARFMPFKHKKPALSDSLVMVFKAWKEGGMHE